MAVVTVDGVRTHRASVCARVMWAEGAWGLFVVVVAVLAVLKPLRPITRIYQASTLDWWAGIPVYTDGIHGFLYFPSSATLFGPLAMLPLPVLDQLWRLLQAGVLAWGVWRAARLMLPESARRATALVLLLLIPTVSINLLRGQWDLMMAAVLLHGAVDIAWNRRVRGAALLALAVALKPLALVAVLLFGALRPRLTPWLLAGLAAVFALPFLHPDPAYVLGQYGAMIEKLRTAAEPDSGRWFELTMLLHTIGIDPGYGVMTGIRATAAAATLGAGWLAVRRLDGRSAALVILWLVFAYLTLFNPRTEEGSYANVALLAALAACAEAARRPRGALAVVLGAAALALGTHMYGDWLYRPTETWIKQAVTLALYAYPAWLVATARAMVEPQAEPAPRGRWRRDRVALLLGLGAAAAIGLARAGYRMPLGSFAPVESAAAALIGGAVLPLTLAAAGPLRRWLRGGG